jgi:hypothetical protein
MVPQEGGAVLHDRDGHFPNAFHRAWDLVMIPIALLATGQ